MNTEWGDADYDGTYPFGTSVVDTGTGGDQLHSVYGVTWSGYLNNKSKQIYMIKLPAEGSIEIIKD